MANLNVTQFPIPVIRPLNLTRSSNKFCPNVLANMDWL